MITPDDKHMITPDDINSEKQLRIRAHFQNQQNLPLALLAGFGAAIISAIVWAIVTVSTEYQIGWMAVGIGFLVGLSVRLGKGIDKLYSVIGALLAFLGCILGNFFSLVGFIAKEEQINVLSIFGMLDYSKVPSLMIETSSPMDILFYGLAVYGGYKYSVRSISSEEIESVQKSIE